MKDYRGDDEDKSMCVDSGDCAAQSARTHENMQPGKGGGVHFTRDFSTVMPSRIDSGDLCY